MSVFKRQIIKGSLFNFRIGLGVLNNIWLFPLRSLEELGIYRWERTEVLIAAIALLGMHRTYGRQVNFRRRASQFLSNIIVIVAALQNFGYWVSYLPVELRYFLMFQLQMKSLHLSSYSRKYDLWSFNSIKCQAYFCSFFLKM